MLNYFIEEGGKTVTILNSSRWCAAEGRQAGCALRFVVGGLLLLREKDLRGLKNRKRVNVNLDNARDFLSCA